MHPFDSYEELAEFLERLPLTWYPALIIVMIHAAIRKGVFKKGKVGKFAADAEKRFKP